MAKKISLIGIVAFLSFFLLTNVAMAWKGIPNRIAKQEKRIDSGVASGHITPAEADILKKNLNTIRTRFDKMTADGVTSRNEFRALETALDRNSSMIHRKKHSSKRAEVKPLF